MKTISSLLLLGVSTTLGAALPAGEPEAPSMAQELSPAAILSAQVSEIAYSTSLPLEAKQARIKTALRKAVSGAIAGMSDPEQKIKIAAEFAVACVKAAPGFAATIADTVTSIPAIAKIDGAATLIRNSVEQTIDELNQVNVAVPAPVLPKAPAAPEFGGSTTDTVVSRAR